MDPLPSQDVLRELEGRAPHAASLWHEVRADALSEGDPEQCRFALAAAARHASGVRRATLLRRLAEHQLLAGQPDAAIVTLQPIGKSLASHPLPEDAETGRALAAVRPRAAADDWATLTPDAALCAVDLTRAEALSHLIRRDEAMSAFQTVEKSLATLDGPAAAQLWIRWARAQTWFLCEILGDATAALDVCRRVRRRVPQVTDVTHALALARAEEVASASAGDFDRARALVEEQISLAQLQKAPREECLAWNARAIVHLADGELEPAKTAYRRALKLAIDTRWRRREAITTHNLAVLAVERLELDEAERLELQYQALSVQIGNTAGQAEAPLVLAAVELARGRLDAAVGLIAQARRAAENGGWDMLVVQARALQGRLHLLRWLGERDAEQIRSARAELEAAVAKLEQHSVAWSEELDPGETLALLAYACARSGERARGAEVVAHGAARLPKQSIVSHHTLELGRAVVEGRPVAEALAWFDERGYRRIVALWTALA